MFLKDTKTSFSAYLNNFKYFNTDIFVIKQIILIPSEFICVQKFRLRRCPHMSARFHIPYPVNRGTPFTQGHPFTQA